VAWLPAPYPNRTSVEAAISTELCICDFGGRPNFSALHAEMRHHRPDVSRMEVFVFDLLFQNSVDLRGLSFTERQRDLPGFAPTGACPAFTWWRPSRRADPCSTCAPPMGLRASCRSDGVPATLVDLGVIGSRPSARTGSARTPSGISCLRTTRNRSPTNASASSRKSAKSLQPPDVRPGLAKESRQHVQAKREIAELTVAPKE